MAHSLVAKANGVNIKGITLMIFGGASEVEDVPKSAGAEFKMTLAGPLSSLVLGGVFLGLFTGGRNADFSLLITRPLLWLGYINIVLGTFNLLPGFPLDGGRLLRSVIWYFSGNLVRAT